MTMVTMTMDATEAKVKIAIIGKQIAIITMTMEAKATMVTMTLAATEGYLSKIFIIFNTSSKE